MIWKLPAKLKTNERTHPCIQSPLKLPSRALPEPHLPPPMMTHHLPDPVFVNGLKGIPGQDPSVDVMCEELGLKGYSRGIHAEHKWA